MLKLLENETSYLPKHDSTQLVTKDEEIYTNSMLLMTENFADLHNFIPAR